MAFHQALLDSWLVHQLTFDRAVLAAAVVCGHQQAPWWAAPAAVVLSSDPQLASVGVTLVGSVVLAAASLAALDFQQAPAWVALACRRWCLGHRL